VKIVILGGYGTFGRLIADQFAASGAEVVIAGRDQVKGQAFADSLKAGFNRCDARSPVSLAETLRGTQLLINAAGQFQARDYSIPQACIEHGCHYIDLGDGREYVAGITQLHESAKARRVFVCVGASTTPAITSAVVSELRPQVARIRSIKIALTAGNKNPAGASTIASILSYVGAPVRVWQDGRWRDQIGWGLGEWIRFPRPVGRRRVQLCDVPDLELFPPRFGADSVVFKAGVELPAVNYLLAALGALRQLRPSWNLPALAGPLVWLSTWFKSLGSLHGSFGVWVTGEAGEERALAFVAPRNGPRVPSSPAVLLARRLLTEGPPVHGAFPCLGYVGLAEYVAFLAPFGIFVVRGEDGVWMPAVSAPPTSTLKELLQAFSRRDVDAMLDCFEPDATAFFPVEHAPARLDGRAAIGQAFAAVIARLPATIAFDPVDLRVQEWGDTATATFHLRGEQLSRRTFVLRRQAGRWRIRHMHASNAPLPG
jgi:ketosteroid isomerase-like protein